MFWKFNLDSSGLETLLAKEDVTLLEVLDEEDVLQECKTPNEKLFDFLTKDEVFREFLHLLVDKPKDDVEESLKYKYMNIACEIVVLDIDAILEKIASEEDYMDIIWSFTDNLPPLNPLIASFFSKVITMLVCRKSQQTFEYLKAHDAVNKLIVHIEISAIVDLFIKMVSVVENPDLRMEIAKWLVEEKLIEKLIDYIHPKEDEEKHYYAAGLLKELILVGRESMLQYQNLHDEYEITKNPLLLTIERKETIEKLLSVMLDHIDEPNSSSSLVNGITPILALIEIKRPNIEGMNSLLAPSDMPTVSIGCHAALDVLATRLADFHDALIRPPCMTPMETTYGTLDPPLGRLRLTITSLIASCIATNSQTIRESLSKTGTINIMLDLFSHYEWNNFLHTHLEHCVYGILNSEVQVSSEEEHMNSDILIRHLFQDCNIVRRCLMWWETNEISEKSGNYRKGYMGHLTKMINDIKLAREKGPNCEILNMIFSEFSEEIHEEWNDLIVGSLEDTNKKNVCAPMNTWFNHIDSDSEGDDYRSLNISQCDGTLQQAFENYQVQPMSNDFIETFGYEECSIEDNENIKNPFADVGKIDFAINANEESENEKLFINICEQKIQPFDDSSDSEEEEDMWDEKELSYAAQSSEKFPNKNSSYTSKRDSSSDEEDDKKESCDLFEDVFVRKPSDRNDKMDIDNEWTATFDSFTLNCKEMSSPWPTVDSSVATSTNGEAFANFEDSPAANPLSTNGEDFANFGDSFESKPLSTNGEDFAKFTDLSKFDISPSNCNDTSLAMDTESGEKTNSSSLYEVKMEEDTENPGESSLGTTKQSEDGDGVAAVDISKGMSSPESAAKQYSTSSTETTSPTPSQPHTDLQHTPEKSSSDHLSETDCKTAVQFLPTESSAGKSDEVLIEHDEKTCSNEIMHEIHKTPIDVNEKCEETNKALLNGPVTETCQNISGNPVT